MVGSLPLRRHRKVSYKSVSPLQSQNKGAVKHLLEDYRLSRVTKHTSRENQQRAHIRFWFMAEQRRRLSFGGHRAARQAEMEGSASGSSSSATPSKPINLPGASRRNADSITHSQPRPLPTPGPRSIVSPIQNLLPSAPASPPTPAPSPTPHKQRLPSWSTANDGEDAFLREARPHFSRLDSQERQRFLAEILNLCNSQQLSFVLNYVSPRLKKDPFKSLPNELCLRVRLSFSQLLCFQLG